MTELDQLQVLRKRAIKAMGFTAQQRHAGTETSYSIRRPESLLFPNADFAVAQIGKKNYVAVAKHKHSKPRAKSKFYTQRSFVIHTAMQDGASATAVQNVSEALDVSQQIVLDLISLPKSTLHRKLQTKKPLDPASTDRLYRITKLLALATEALASEEKARRWLTTPLPALGNNAPLSLIDTEVGYEQAKDVLEQLLHGVIG